MISTRLKTLASYHHHSSSSIWDIGCDHGLLGLSFVDNLEINNIHLVDPSIDVINVLTKKPEDSYITKKPLIKIHRSKGQSLILNPECKTIFIAGMGGKEIEEIIRHLIPQLRADDRLVVSPHRNILELRKSLMTTELGLLDEIVIEEDEQFYQVLCLMRDCHLPKVPRFGQKIWQGPTGEKYRKHQIHFVGQHKDEHSKAYVSFLSQGDV